MLTGEIKVGDRLLWEKDDPMAFERVTVVKVESTRVLLRSRRGEFWNGLDRVLEACDRDDLNQEFHGDQKA